MVPSMPAIPERLVSSALDQYDKRPQKSRISTPGYTHVSSLIGACVRQHALAKRFEIEHLETVTGGHRVMWEIGRAVERHARSGFIESREARDVYGDWRCRCKQASHIGFRPDRTCFACCEPLDQYHEPVLRDEDNRIIGSPDMTVVLGSYYYLPVEIKSMNKEQFDKLEAPLMDHINQAAMYRYLYKLAGFAVHDKVIIHYTKKEFQWGSPYKEFHVDCTAPAIETMVDMTIDTARRIALAVEHGTAPARTICQSPTNSKAKACPVAHLCFSLGQD